MTITRRQTLIGAAAAVAAAALPAVAMGSVAVEVLTRAASMKPTTED
jgi:hypothetical protein